MTHDLIMPVPMLEKVKLQKVAKIKKSVHSIPICEFK